MPFRTIDLCAGIGGIRKGFEMTGDYVNVLSAEVDKYACLTYEHLYGENPNNDLTSEKFKNTVENTQYDVMLAGLVVPETKKDLMTKKKESYLIILQRL